MSNKILQPGDGADWSFHHADKSLRIGSITATLEEWIEAISALESQSKIVFCPVYLDHSGNEFVITHEDFMGDTHDEAYMIAYSTSLVETILMGIKFQRIIEVDLKNFLHREGKLGPYHVAVISGPAFDEAATVKHTPEETPDAAHTRN